MSRIPTHTVEDAPAASRPLVQKIVEATPTTVLPAQVDQYQSLNSLRCFRTTGDRA